MSGDGEWFRWVGGIAMGAAYVILGWFSLEIRELRKKIDDTSRNANDDIEKSENRWRSEMKDIAERQRREMEGSANRLEARITRFEEKQDEFRLMIEEDRKLAATDRANIAASMLTRIEFDRQMDRRFPERSRAAGG